MPGTVPPVSGRGFKRKFGLAAYFDALVLSHRSLLCVMANRLRPRIDERFVERLMLAVTEVNGCAACSYAHTRIALQNGMSRDEIEGLLSANGEHVPAGEVKGILFAQHYADSGARPASEAHEALVAEYGPKKSRVIVAAIQVIMTGNIIGIPLSALHARLKGRRYMGSSLFYEVGLPLSSLVLFPFSLVHAFCRWVAGRDNIRFACQRHEQERKSTRQFRI